MSISTHEYFWGHCAMLMSAHGCLWGFMSEYECSRESMQLIRAHKCSWRHPQTYSWLLMSIQEILISSHEHSCQQHSWELTSIHKLDTMAPLSLIVPWLLTYKCSQVLMGALECSLVFLSDPECSSSWPIDTWKMLILEMIPYQLAWPQLAILA